MDPMGLPMYQHSRMTMMGESDIGSVPGSIPMNDLMGNPIQGTMGMQEAPMSDNHATFTQERQFDKMPMQHHYTQPQPPLREEVDDEILLETPKHILSEGNDAGQEEVSQEKIKTEKDDISDFMEMAHDIFLKISSKELKIKEAADFLGRPYSFVYSRYQEFCGNITGEITIKKKKKTKLKKNGKKKRKAKKLTLSRSRSGKKYQCEDCPAIFHTEYLIKAHSKVHVEGNESHLCTECGIVFSKVGQLMMHRIEAHEEALQCPHCDKQFTIIASYKFHLKTHTEARPHVCDECGKGFFSKFNLEGHYRKHTGERPFMCGYCEKTFTTLNILKTHQYVHTGRANQPKNFECEECGHKYLSNDDLEQHMNTHTGARPFACDHCDARFNFKANLARHKQIHTGVRPYKCNYCPAAFFQPIDLTRHNMAHTGIKPYKCDQCDYSSSRKHNLEFHKNTHTGATPFKCEFYGCNAEYSRPTSLKHHKLSHGPPPPKTCKVCNEKFPDFISLKRHMMLHTGEKPLTCEQCFKVFYAESSLNRHMATHMYKPPGPKVKQIRKRRTNPGVIKSGGKSETAQKKWPSEYQAPAAAENGHSSIAQSWTINAEDTKSQQPIQSFASSQYSNLAASQYSNLAASQYSNLAASQYSNLAASQYTNLVNNAWPTTMDPDELRRRLLSSFK